MSLFLILLVLGAGSVAYLAYLLRSLRSRVTSSLSDSEKLRAQFASAIAEMSARARTSEDTIQDLLSAHRKLVEANALLGSESHRQEVEFLRGQNAHLTSALYESAHTAQRRILELASPQAGAAERSLLPGYRPLQDGFRAMPPEDSPVDTIRYPEETRTVRSSAAPKEGPPLTSEAAPYRVEQPFPAPQNDFGSLADVDEVFRPKTG